MLGTCGDARAGVCPQWRGTPIYYRGDHGNYHAVFHDDVCILSSVLQQEALISSASIGIIAAFFFFAVREVYASSLLVAVCSVFTMANRINPAYVQNAVPYVWSKCIPRSQCFDGCPLVSFTKLYDLKGSRDMTGTFLV